MDSFRKQHEKQREDPFLVLSSPSNHTVKYVKSLLSGKYREKNHCFSVEGRKMVSEAMSSGFSVDMLLFSETGAGPASDPDPLLTLAGRKNIPWRITTDRIFRTVSDTQTPQGVLAVVREKDYSPEEIIGQSPGFLVILDGVRDPGNVGTIVRTVDAAGGKGVILIHDCADPYQPKVVRGTMGSVFRVPVVRCETEEVTDRLVHLGYHVLASHLEGSDLFQWQGGYDRTALVIGNESRGVSRQMMDLADSLVKIPMTGGAESLNASVAAGILIYEIFRKGRNMDK
ncbi:RNA methyltransferase [Eubacteriales bacterium mix99]